MPTSPRLRGPEAHTFATWEQLATLSGGRLTAGAALCGLLRDAQICAALAALGIRPDQVQLCSPAEPSGTKRGELRIEARRDLATQAGLVFLSGRFQGPAAREHLHAELERERAAGTRRLLLDLSWVRYLDSGGLGSLVVEAERFERAGGELLLLGVPAKVRVVIEMLGLDTYLPAARSVTEGWRRLGLWTPPMVAPPRVATALAIARREEQRYGLTPRAALLIGLLAAQPRAASLFEARGCAPHDLRRRLPSTVAPGRRRHDLRRGYDLRPSTPERSPRAGASLGARRDQGQRPCARPAPRPAASALLVGGLAAGLALLLAGCLG